MRTVAVVVVLTWVTLALAQSHSKPQPAKKELSPEQQMWCPVLEYAVSGAKAAEPPMRSYLLDTIAGGLSKCDPRKVRIALVDSFTATLAMPENQEEISQRTLRFVSEGQRVDQATVESIFNLETKQR